MKKTWRRNSRWIIGVGLGLLLTCCLNRTDPSATSATVAPDISPQASMDAQSSRTAAEAVESPDVTEGGKPKYLSLAITSATTAANLAQSAQTAEDWDAVTLAWIEALQNLQSVSPDDPQRVFTQRKAREYFQNLEVARLKAEQASPLRVFPTLGSPIFDEQVGLYHSYVASVGVPDILIVGSSRTLQGLDPQILQQALAGRGYSNLRVYNFSVNGATAQVVSFILRYLLEPEHLPRMVIWAGGSRAFNSARFDRTFAEVLESPGYAAVMAGASPLPTDKEEDWEPPANSIPMPISRLDANGFMPVNERFNPSTYYRQFPRVSGRFDDAYRPFRLDGVQAVSFDAVTTFLNAQGIPLIFVNLPLSDDYLDSYRLRYERQFQAFLQQQSSLKGFTLVDLLEQWRGQNDLFADPSHINRFGAGTLAQQLVIMPQIPWDQLQPPAFEGSVNGSAEEEGTAEITDLDTGEEDATTSKDVPSAVDEQGE